MEKIAATDQSLSDKAIIELSDDSPGTVPLEPHPFIKLLEDQLAGAKNFLASLVRSNQELKQRCKEKIHNAKIYFRNKYLKLGSRVGCNDCELGWTTIMEDPSQRRFKSIAELYESFGFDIAKDNCRAINDRTVNKDDVDSFNSSLGSGSDSSDDDSSTSNSSNPNSSTPLDINRIS